MLRVFVLLAGIIALSPHGAAAVTVPPLIPLADNPGGQSAATSVRQWSQWSFSFDNVVDGGNPVTDETGAFQNRKQTFPVFQLGGTVSAGVKRAFTAPGGKPFAIPIFTGTCLGSDAVGTCVGDETIKDYIDNTKRLFLSIDGHVIIDAKSRHAVDGIESNYRVNTGIFALDLVPNNWASEVNNFPDLKGPFPESYADGFFAFANLAVGHHSVIYSGVSFSEALGGRVSNRVTAEINVIPIPAALPLLLSGLLGLGLVARRRRAAT